MNLISAKFQANDIVVGGARDQGYAVDSGKKVFCVERYRRSEVFRYNAVIIGELPFD